MLFNSVEFIIFFAIVCTVYFLAPLYLKTIILLVASVYFYMSWHPIYILLLLFTTSVDYFVALGLSKTEDKFKRRWLLYITFATNLSLLFFFKYYNFFAHTFNKIDSYFELPLELPHYNVILPLGISFYTFHALCYAVDVYRKKLPAERNFINYMVYILFFPQLIAGPIQRATKFLPQLQSNDYKFDFNRVADGLLFMIWGLLIKITIADNLAPYADKVFANPQAYEGFPLLLASYAFSLQIFCDFAGYSIVAVGAAKVLGFTIMDNFRAPYLSRNISEFWRRWHISLSSWFRDYVFSPYYMHIESKPEMQKYPLKVRHHIAFFVSLFVTEILLGFWHGANWNFGLFGVYHAVLIWLYYIGRNYWEKMHGYLQLFLSFQLAVLGFIIFRVRSVRDLPHILSNLFNDRNSILLLLSTAVSLIIADVIYNKGGPKIAALSKTKFTRFATFVLWIYAVIFVIFFDVGFPKEGRQFIYFQF